MHVVDLKEKYSKMRKCTVELPQLNFDQALSLCNANLLLHHRTRAQHFTRKDASAISTQLNSSGELFSRISQIIPKWNRTNDVLIRTAAIILDEAKIPRRWYNVLSDFAELSPLPLKPQTLQPFSPENMAPLFLDSIIQQKMSSQRYIDIPEELLDVYKLWCPTPLFRYHEQA